MAEIAAGRSTGLRFLVGKQERQVAIVPGIISGRVRFFPFGLRLED
jgi:hypothetical protein